MLVTVQKAMDAFAIVIDLLATAVLEGKVYNGSQTLVVYITLPFMPMTMIGVIQEALT
jgi:hypothetical protein